LGKSTIYDLRKPAEIAVRAAETARSAALLRFRFVRAGSNPGRTGFMPRLCDRCLPALEFLLPAKDI